MAISMTKSSTTIKESLLEMAKILLVEDEQSNILVAKAWLDEFGYDYDIAHDGVEAVEKYRTNNYSLVLMDVHMNGLSGYEATQQIRQIEKDMSRAEVPVIAMTALTLIGDQEKCISNGMNDYISKPFSNIELRAKLSHYLKNLKTT